MELISSGTLTSAWWCAYFTSYLLLGQIKIHKGAKLNLLDNKTSSFEMLHVISNNQYHNPYNGLFNGTLFSIYGNHFINEKINTDVYTHV